MAKGTIYYYFRLNLNGNPYAIKESALPINTTIMRNYQEMTAEQIAFYLEHPTASISEIVKCELNPPYVPPTPDLQEYIEQKLKELKDACYGSVTVTSLEYAIAEDKSNHITADSYYSLVEANQVLSDFRSQSKHAMTVLNTYKSQIEAAQSVESVDDIYDEAINKL